MNFTGTPAFIKFTDDQSISYFFNTEEEAIALILLVSLSELVPKTRIYTQELLRDLIPSPDKASIPLLDLALQKSNNILGAEQTTRLAALIVKNKLKIQIDQLYIYIGSYSNRTKNIFGSYHVVHLTPMQLNTWLGKDAWVSLQAVNELNRQGCEPELENKLRTLPPALLNHAVQLTNEVQSCVLNTLVAYDHHPDFHALMNVLPPIILQNLALLPEIQFGSFFLFNLAIQRQPDVFRAFLNLVGNTICAQAAATIVEYDQAMPRALHCHADLLSWRIFIEHLPWQTVFMPTSEGYLPGWFTGAGIRAQYDEQIFMSILNKISTSDFEQFLSQPNVKASSFLRRLSDCSDELFQFVFDKMCLQTKLRAVFELNHHGHYALIYFLGRKETTMGLFLTTEFAAIKRYIQKHPVLFNPEIISSEREIISLIKGLSKEPFRQLLLLLAQQGEGEFAHFLQMISPQFYRTLPTQTLIDDMFTKNENGVSLFQVLINKMPESMLTFYLSLLIQNPHITNQNPDLIFALNSIAFHDNSESKEEWSPITKKLVNSLPDCKPWRQERIIDGHFLPTRKRPRLSENYFDKLRNNAWNFFRLQGRTILLINREGSILALKIQKKSEQEEPGTLFREYNATAYLKEHRQVLGLLSEFPTPLEVIEIPDVLTWVESQAQQDDPALPGFIAMILDPAVNNASHTVYIYQVPPNASDYFTYLHDPGVPNELFFKIIEQVTHDLIVLLQKGLVFPQLADIFHNKDFGRSDGGRFIILANLLKDLSAGSGRVTDWLNAIVYPNIRSSKLLPLADVGDSISINDLINNSSFIHKYFGRTREIYGKKTGNVMLLNIIAEYLYIIQLNAGRRARELTLHQNNSQASKKIWLDTATQLIKNAALVISLTTTHSRAEAERFLFATINVQHYARQMRYWMTSEHINDIANDSMPDADKIYGKGVKITLDKSKISEGTFNPVTGSSVDGENPDLGMVNGQEPITEGIKLFYTMANAITNNFLQHYLTLQDLKKIYNQPDPEKSEQIRNNSFLHLPPKQYHAIQKQLCETRLKQLEKTSLNPKEYEHVRAEKTFYEKSHAAAIIQGFWRQRRKIVPERNEPCSSSQATASLSLGLVCT